MRTAVCLIAALMAACGSPPPPPKSLWDSLPGPPADAASASQDEPAKEVPAKKWEEKHEESAEPTETPEESVAIVGKVVINEIYYDAVGSDTDGVVFVELYGDPDLPIGGAKLNFVDGGDGSVDDTITLPEGARIAADGFYIVADARTGSATVTNIPGADLIDNFDPQNGPDAVQLLDRSESLLDAVAYGEGVVPTAENGLATFETAAAMDVINGHSLERIAPGVDTDDNAVDFVDRETPTPGQ